MSRRWRTALGDGTTSTAIERDYRGNANEADRLAQRIEDWRDPDDFRRARGAERADYVRAGAKRLPANADFSRVEELRDVAGMTPALFARIAPLASVLGPGQLQVTTAPRAGLRSPPRGGLRRRSAVRAGRAPGRVRRRLGGGLGARRPRQAGRPGPFPGHPNRAPGRSRGGLCASRGELTSDALGSQNARPCEGW